MQNKLTIGDIVLILLIILPTYVPIKYLLGGLYSAIDSNIIMYLSIVFTFFIEAIIVILMIRKNKYVTTKGPKKDVFSKDFVVLEIGKFLFILIVAFLSLVLMADRVGISSDYIANRGIELYVLLGVSLIVSIYYSAYYFNYNKKETKYFLPIISILVLVSTIFVSFIQRF